MIPIRKAEGRAIRSYKRRISAFSSRQRSNCITCCFIVGNIAAVVFVGRCCIQFKLHAFQRIAALVYLFNAVVERGLEVEAHLQTGIVISPFQIE